jgi:hypothetical protein
MAEAETMPPREENGNPIQEDLFRERNVGPIFPQMVRRLHLSMNAYYFVKRGITLIAI